MAIECRTWATCVKAVTHEWVGTGPLESSWHREHAVSCESVSFTSPMGTRNMAFFQLLPSSFCHRCSVTVPLGSAPLFVTDSLFILGAAVLQEAIRPSGVLGKVGLGHAGCSSLWETHFPEYKSNPPLSNTDNPLPANQSSRHHVSIYGLSIYGRDAQTHFLLPCLSLSIPSLVYPFLSLPSLLSFSPFLPPSVCLFVAFSLFVFKIWLCFDVLGTHSKRSWWLK